MGTACNKPHLVRVKLSTLAGKFVLMTMISESMCGEEEVGQHFEIQKLTKILCESKSLWEAPIKLRESYENEVKICKRGREESWIIERICITS